MKRRTFLVPHYL